MPFPVVSLPPKNERKLPGRAKQRDRVSYRVPCANRRLKSTSHRWVYLRRKSKPSFWIQTYQSPRGRGNSLLLFQYFFQTEENSLWIAATEKLTTVANECTPVRPLGGWFPPSVLLWVRTNVREKNDVFSQKKHLLKKKRKERVFLFGLEKLGYRNSNGPSPLSPSLIHVNTWICSKVTVYYYIQTIKNILLLLLLLLQLLNSLSPSRVSSLHARHSLEKILLVVVEDVLVVLRVQT